MQTAQYFYASKSTSCQISFLKCENKVLYSNTVSGASESRLRAAYNGSSNSMAVIEESFADVPSEARHRMVAGNAIDFFHLG